MCVVATLACSAAAFGAIYPWAYMPLVAASALLGVVGLIWGRGPVPWPLIASLALVALAVSLQLVPLNESTLASLSPRALDIHRQRDLAAAVGAAASFPLSIDPPQTRLALMFLAAFALLLAGTARMLTRPFGPTGRCVAGGGRRGAGDSWSRATRHIQRQDLRVLGARARRLTVRAIYQPQPFCGLDADGRAADGWSLCQPRQPQDGGSWSALARASAVVRIDECQQGHIGGLRGDDDGTGVGRDIVAIRYYRLRRRDGFCIGGVADATFRACARRSQARRGVSDPGLDRRGVVGWRRSDCGPVHRAKVDWRGRPSCDLGRLVAHGRRLPAYRHGAQHLRLSRAVLPAVAERQPYARGA